MYLHQQLTERIIQCFFEVYNTLGYGFLEKVYEHSMMIELRCNGLAVESQKPIEVQYRSHLVGDYYADIVVENAVILEWKAAESVIEEHEFQLINYLKATSVEVGLLLNFGKKPEIRRKIFTNDRKENGSLMTQKNKR
ncbi:MAG: GxxExxY protein [Bacteroidetes bacterium]|nr:GxxExxY protein [Bacteroidota bacterium]